jgi:hypothetical protein
MMQHGNHLKQMAIVGGVLLVGLLAFGVPTGSALITAAALACPIGMGADDVLHDARLPWATARVTKAAAFKGHTGSGVGLRSGQE